MKRPLEGIRIIDMSRIWAGPLGTRFLTDMGAQVIKIQEESRFLRAATPARSVLGPETGGADMYWMMNEANKLGMSLDISTEKGQAVFKRLVAVSDVVLENFRPSVMERFGLDYDSLRAVKPDLIMMSLTAMGHTGPERMYAAYGATIDGLSGLAFHTGYPGEETPVRTGINYADPVTGMQVAAAVMLALIHRQRTGKGQYIDISLRETIMTQLDELFMEYSMNNRFLTRLGNRKLGFAPQGAYTVLGEDRWITVAVNSDAEWRAFCQVLGRDDFLEDRRYQDMASRWANHDSLDQAINDTTAKQDGFELAERLQAVGVAAMPVVSITELLESPQLQARGFWKRIVLADGAGYHYMTPAWKLSRTPGITGDSPPPRYAQHNRDVLCGILGMSEAEVATLEEEGVLGNTAAQPEESVPAAQ
jgi:crotonobetainyl-CoA:carnitine CoA-transferase CaiB-like acyl-CoA transferase